MATPYQTIFDVFINKITDYDFLSLDTADIEEILTKYIKSALVKFKVCKKDLSDRDDNIKTFNITLTEEEVEILATLMVVEWLSPKINAIELLKQSLSTKDFSMYSQANHLKELRELKKDMRNESKQLLISYGYSSGLEKLT